MGQRVTFYLMRTPSFEPGPTLPTAQLRAENVAGLAWWTSDDLAVTDEAFAPGRLPEPVAALVAAGQPAGPGHRHRRVSRSGARQLSSPIRERATSYVGRRQKEDRRDHLAMAHGLPRPRSGGKSWVLVGCSPQERRHSPPSDTTSPTPDTLTECVGFRGFRAMSCPETHLGWRDGGVTATPTPDTTDGLFGLVTGLWRSQECRLANGLLIRAGRCRGLSTGPGRQWPGRSHVTA